MPQFVFLDTQVYEAESFNINSARFRALAKHLDSGRLRLVITDITKVEISRRIDQATREEVSSLSKFRKKARVLRTANESQTLGLFSDSHLDNIVAIVFGEVDAFLTTKNAIVVSAMEQNAKAIFELYFAVEPPFGDGTKRNEFPDAFVISALVDWCHDRKEDLFVVTQDGLFLKACEEEPRLDAVECLSGLLNRVASDEAALADFLRTQILEHLEEIENRTKEDFESLGFHVEDEWGDAEVSVTKIELEGGPDLVDVTGTMVSAELRFDAEYDAYLSYDDSSTGSYDSEEGRLLYMEHKTETVNGTERLFVTVTASFQGMEELDFQLVDVDLTSPSAGFGIETEKNAGWPWK